MIDNVHIETCYLHQEHSPAEFSNAAERQQGSKAPKTFLKFVAWFAGPGRLKAQLPNFFHGLKPRSPPAKLRLGCAGSAIDLFSWAVWVCEA